MVARVSASMLGRVHDLVGVLSSDRAGEGHHGGLTVDRSPTRTVLRRCRASFQERDSPPLKVRLDVVGGWAPVLRRGLRRPGGPMAARPVKAAEWRR